MLSGDARNWQGARLSGLAGALHNSVHHHDDFPCGRRVVPSSAGGSGEARRLASTQLNCLPPAVAYALAAFQAAGSHAALATSSAACLLQERARRPSVVGDLAAAAAAHPTAVLFL